MSCNEWKEVSLAEVTELISRGITPSYTEHDGVRVINQKCIRNNRINLELARLTNPIKRKISEQKKLKLYDILVNSTGVGTLGRVAQVKELDQEVTVDSHITIVRANDKINPRFLGYNLFMQQKNIEHLAHGSTGQTELSRVRLGEAIKIKVPSIREQDKIVSILFSLDEKIELNNEMNKTLEEMAQALFKRWFVDFEFPNEEGKPYKSSGGEMVESEMGMIPKGWSVKKLGELINVIDNRGKTPPLSNEKTDFPIIDVKALSGDNRIINYENCTKFVEKETYENWFRSGHPIDGDILLSTVGTIGEMKIFYGNTGCIAQNVVALRVKRVSPIFLYQYLKHIKQELIAYNIGSVQPSIKITQIIKHKVLLSNNIIESKFSNLVNNLSEKIYDNVKENDLLKTIRDSLLPKLMSGEIRVNDIEANL